MTSRASRALVRARIGRVLIKLHRWEEAVVAYRTLLDEPAEVVDRNGIPYVVVARTQLVDAFAASGRPDDAARERAALLAYLLEHPWDVDNGYGYYLGLAATVAGPRSRDARAVQALRRSIRTIEWARREVQPLIEAPPTGADEDQPFTVRTSVSDGRESLRCVRASAAALCFSFAADYVAGTILSDVLQRVELGREISGRDIGRQRNALVVECVTSRVDRSWLRTGVVDCALRQSGGRSVAELVRRERWMYGILITAMVLMLIGGTSLMLRVSSREAELVRLKSEFVSNVSHELKRRWRSSGCTVKHWKAASSRTNASGRSSAQ